MVKKLNRTVDPEPVVWLVQYNLIGLHPVYKLTYDANVDGWYDRSGNVGFQTEGRDFPKNITNDGVVARFFYYKENAVAFHTELKTYRDFIRSHI
jgi:hypothetical protein